MGIVAKGEKCHVSGCDEVGVRSISTTKVQDAGLDVSSSGKNQFFVRHITKSGKKKLKMIDH